MPKYLHKMISNRLFRIFLPATAGMILYSSWAYLVNLNTDHAVLSALVEGSRVFVFTTLGNMLTEGVWRLTQRLANMFLRVVTSSLSTWVIMQSIALSIHWSINPQTALQTISLSLIISSVYVVAYILSLARLEKLPASAGAP